MSPVSSNPLVRWYDASPFGARGYEDAAQEAALRKQRFDLQLAQNEAALRAIQKQLLSTSLTPQQQQDLLLGATKKLEDIKTRRDEDQTRIAVDAYGKKSDIDTRQKTQLATADTSNRAQLIEEQTNKGVLPVLQSLQTQELTLADRQSGLMDKYLAWAEKQNQLQSQENEKNRVPRMISQLAAPIALIASALAPIG